MTRTILPVRDAQDSQLRSNHDEDAARPETSRDQRIRSLSLSLPWRRPKSALLNHMDLRQMPNQVSEQAIDDTHDSLEQTSHAGPVVGLKDMLRRASSSIRGIVHRRQSIVADDSKYERDILEGRPTTAYGTWNKFRQAAAFRRSRSFYGLDFKADEDASSQTTQATNEKTSQLPLPCYGDSHGPYIPAHSGAAAKASAAMQNEYLARYGLQNRWLYPTNSEESNDRESGIGIVVSEPNAGTNALDYENSLLNQDSSISRIDFITELPTELAIHILAELDAAALAQATLVRRSWAKIIQNPHIWRESCLREMSSTYATSDPIQPNTGLGIPAIGPGNDWKKIYEVKQDLAKRWLVGKARPVYLNGHSDSIYCLQFDEHKIISGSRDKTIRIWDMHTLECKMVIGSPEVIRGANILQDGDGNVVHFATGPDNQRTALSKPKVWSFLEHHKASILCLQYDEEILVTGSSDATAIVYDIKDGYKPIRRLRQHTAAVLDLVFDKKHIVTCSKDVSICVWDRETGALVRQLRGHSGPVNAVQMRGNIIVSCSGDFLVKLWNIDTGKNIREFAGHTKGLACSQFSEDGRYVASAGNDKVIRIWDANTGECVREMRAHEGLVRSLHIDSVSGRLISGSYDTDIKVWDMETGHQLLDFPKWHASWVLSAKSDYRRIVSTGQDPKILIMDFGADIKGIEMLESSNPDGSVVNSLSQ